MTVYDLKPGETGVITSIEMQGGAKSRLESLGICLGATVEVISFSLFKSSVMVSCSAVRLGLRKSLAQKIGVRHD